MPTMAYKVQAPNWVRQITDQPAFKVTVTRRGRTKSVEDYVT